MVPIGTVRRMLDDDARLATGVAVVVRWGRGLGYRAIGRGVVDRVFTRSVRVRLTEDVALNGKVAWRAGHVLKGIPRFAVPPADGWAEWNSVTAV